jgi:hypothetical protein
MAANDYYSSFNPEPPRYEQQSTFNYEPYSEHQSSVDDGPSASPEPHKQAYRDSQNSLLSDGHHEPLGGVATSNDSYAEYIPLRANAQQPYEPSPSQQQQDRQYAQEMPMTPGVNTRHQRQQKRGFFKKKIPWVTILLTIIDIGVFIGELVRSGASHFDSMPNQEAYH